MGIARADLGGQVVWEAGDDGVARVGPGLGLGLAHPLRRHEHLRGRAHVPPAAAAHAAPAAAPRAHHARPSSTSTSSSSEAASPQPAPGREAPGPRRLPGRDGHEAGRAEIGGAGVGRRRGGGLPGLPSRPRVPGSARARRRPRPHLPQGHCRLHRAAADASWEHDGFRFEPVAILLTDRASKSFRREYETSFY